MASTEIPSNISRIIGPMLLGYFFNWGLFGVLAVQTYYYFLCFPRDRSLLKVLVLLTFLFELTQTVLITRDAWLLFVEGWGQVAELTVDDLVWFFLPIQTAIIGVMTQLFFAWRIWVLSRRSLIIPVLAIILCTAEIVAGLWTGIYGHMVNTFQHLLRHIIRPDLIWLVSAVVCDIIVTWGMTYYLFKSKTGFRSTDDMLSKITRIIIETGALTSTFALVDLALSVAYEEWNYHLAASLVLSKLYSNNLLVILNARARFMTRHDSDDRSQNGFFGAPDGGVDRVPKSPGGIINVQISREIHTDRNTRIELENVRKHPKSLPDQKWASNLDGGV